MATECRQDLLDFGVRWAEVSVIKRGKVPPR